MTATELSRAEDEIVDIFRDAGVRGWLHATPVDGETPRLRAREVAVGAGSPVVMASVYKIVVLGAWCRRVDSGDLDPTVLVACPVERRTAGPTGLSSLADPAVLSARDLVRSMITVSDNAAADLVLGLVGLDAVRDLLVDLGLHDTRITGGTAATHAELVADTAALDVAGAFWALADHDTPAVVRALDPAYGSATTPRDMTRLLAAWHHGKIASPEQTRWALGLLEAQIWPHRLRAGFPEPVRVAGKTGTLGPLRNEIGLVTYPGEHPVAVSVFTHAARPEFRAPRADAAIAAAARTAVAVLRSGDVED